MSVTPEDDAYVLSQTARLPFGSFPTDGQTYLALRCELYMALAAQHDLPYLPDALRSRLILHGSRASYQRVSSAARPLLRNLDRAVDSARARKEQLAPELPRLQVSTPSTLGLVLSKAETPDAIIPAVMELRSSHSAVRLRKALGKLQDDFRALPTSRRSIDEKLESFENVTSEFVAEQGGDGRSRMPSKTTGKAVIQGFVSLVTPIMLGQSPVDAAVESTASVLASLDLDQIRRWILRHQVAFLKDPLLEGARIADLATDLSRLFSRPPSADTLALFRSLRGLEA